MNTATPTTIADCSQARQRFKLKPTSTVVYEANPHPFNLYPKRADAQYINCIMIAEIKPVRGRWGAEYQRQKLLPLTTPAYPVPQ